MIGKRTSLFAGTQLAAAFALAACVALGTGNAHAVPQYLDNGATQNAEGGWTELPAQGACPQDPSQTTRPDCLALRLNFASSATCAPTPVPVTGALRSWTTGGVCNDLVNTTQTACEAIPGRKWNANPNGTNTCAIVMKGDDRNNVVCALSGGTWVTTGTCTGNWVMPAADAYTPNLLISVPPAPAGTGDQCLRCHNSQVEYNSTRVRDTENFIYTGHQNMSRKVDQTHAAGSKYPWGGPPFSCSNPLFTDEQTCEDNGGEWDPTVYLSDDSGNVFDWANGQITVSGTARDLLWIAGDWIAPLPRAFYKTDAAATPNTCSDPRPGVCDNPTYVSEGTCLANAGTWTKNNTQTGCQTNGGTWLMGAGTSYSCARCHTTGWTSDATINAGGTGIDAKEPEASFPNLTWNRTADASFGLVNLSGGVSGDSNKYASWDVFGIKCSRCHSAAIETTLATCYFDPAVVTSSATCTAAPYSGTWQLGITRAPFSGAAGCFKSGITQAACTAITNNIAYGAPYSGPTGMSSHHNDLTSATVPTTGDKGYCTDSKYTARTQCDNAGAAWLTQCSIAGACSNPAYTTSGTCKAGGATWTPYTDSTTCGANGGTWQAAGACSVQGVCVDMLTGVLDPTKNTSALCTGGNLQWAAATDIVRCLDIHEYGKENNIAAYEAAVYTGNKTSRGQIITRLCMDCHRQETGGVPYMDSNDKAGDENVHPGEYVKFGPVHSTVEAVSHPHGNMFLKSPHGQFSGKFSEIATGTYKADGTGLYKSRFMTKAEAANTGNGCTGCHNVHESVVPNTSPFSAIHEECTECHAKDLNLVMHPKGGGTPLENMDTEPAEACEMCHMPEGMHLWRINADETYSTFPNTALTATVNANTSRHGNVTNAVWVDVNLACGQCHGGGNANTVTTASTTSGSKVITVADPTGFEVGARVKVAGIGAFEADGVTREDLITYVASLTGNSITLALGTSTVPVTLASAAVELNPVKGGAYMSKSRLAEYAAAMHNDKPLASFTYTLGNPNTLTINVDASATLCTGSNANCTAYDWNWGDGTAHGTGVTASHTYATAGTKTVTLTVTEDLIGSASKSRPIAVYAPDFGPTVNGTACGSILDGNTWIGTLADTSTDDNAIGQVVVTWGDGVLSSDTTAPFGPFTHTYANAGNYTITHKAIDTIGQQSVRTCSVVSANFLTFEIGGTVFQSNGTTPVPGAVVTIKRGANTVKTLFTSSTAGSVGTFSAGNLKPGTYTLTITKAGYTFTSPAATITVGPSSTTNSINAVTP